MERPPTPAFQPYTQLPQIRHIYLDRYQSLPSDAPLSLQWLQLIVVDGIEATIEQVKQFHQAHQPLELNDLDLLETIVSYKLPQLTAEDIKAMLNLADADLKQSRFYQEIIQRGKQEGKREGKQEGKREGEQIGKVNMLLTQITFKFGKPSQAVVKRVKNAEVEQLDVWSRRILTANSVAELFA